MADNEKERGFMDIVKDGISCISGIISASIFPLMAEGTEIVMKTIDDRIAQIEQRFQRKITSFLTIGLGGLFLIFSLFFFLIEFEGWSKAAAFFSIGITIFIIGLLLKITEKER